MIKRILTFHFQWITHISTKEEWLEASMSKKHVDIKLNNDQIRRLQQEDAIIPDNQRYGKEQPKSQWRLQDS